MTGSGFRGVGIPDCVADARATARQVAEWLDQTDMTAAVARLRRCSRAGARSPRRAAQSQSPCPTSLKLLAGDQGRRHGPAGRLGRRRPLPARDGRHQHAKRALEIGGANGYSAIWIGLGLRQTGGT